MTSLKIQNNLDVASARDFLYRGPGVLLPGNPITPGDTGNTVDIDDYDYRHSYSFNIDGERIHNSSIAVSLKGFSHAMELVDKCQGPDYFVLLRFVPIADAVPLPADVLVECLSQPKSFGVNSSTIFQETAIAFNSLKYPRNAKLKRIYPSKLEFNAQYQITDSRINIGVLSPTEILEIYLEGTRLDKLTRFEIFVKGITLKITLLDYGINYGGGITPHIEAIIEYYNPGPGNINITIQGDET